MINMTMEEISRAVKGKLIINNKDELSVTNISIDSRQINKGDLFVAIKGERFDGHAFIDDVVAKGAALCIVEDGNIRNISTNIIIVKDTLKALHDLALHYRRKFSIPFVAITGSSGKTTTKDMIASVLEQKYKVLKTQGNYNNEIGLPLTLFQLEKQHEIAVIEMGMNHLGEISKLVHMVYPDISVITNVGVTHIENLGSQEMIFKAKKEILETLSSDQVAVLNGDDPYLSTVESGSYDISFVGIKGQNLKLRAKDIQNHQEGVSFCVEDEWKNTTQYKLRLPGMHNIYNSLLAIYIGKHFNLSHDEIQEGLFQFKPSKMRMDIFNAGQVTVINDAYNANPDSMKAALRVLKDIGNSKRKIAVLGDMLEMGKWAYDAHRDIGKFLGELNIDYFVAVGQYRESYAAGAVEGGVNRDRIKECQSNKEAIEYIDAILEREDVLLVKGSRGMKMEEIIRYLQERS